MKILFKVCIVISILWIGYVITMYVIAFNSQSFNEKLDTNGDIHIRVFPVFIERDIIFKSMILMYGATYQKPIPFPTFIRWIDAKTGHEIQVFKNNEQMLNHRVLDARKDKIRYQYNKGLIQPINQINYTLLFCLLLIPIALLWGIYSLCFIFVNKLMR